MSDEDRVTMRSLKEDARHNIIERWETELRGNKAAQEDAPSETADSLTPVMNYTLLALAQDDIWLALEEPDVYAFDGEPTAINAIAGNVYEALHEAAREAIEEMREQDEWNTCSSCGEVKPDDIDMDTGLCSECGAEEEEDER
jgi:hypothetical protein